MAQIGAVEIGWFYTPPGSSNMQLCSVGSGVMLTNEWLLSAAHVLKDPCDTIVPEKLVVSMKGSPFDQSQIYGQSELAQLKVYAHPRYVPDSTGQANYGTDAALMKLKAPLLIQGAATGHKRWMTPKPAADFVLAGKKSFYGYSFSSPPATWPPPDSVFGNPTTADFTVVPYPGLSADPAKEQQLLKRAPSPNEFAVLRGGGFFPSSNTTDIIPVAGDSGGPPIDVSDPILWTGDIVGILETGDSTPQPEYAYFSAASGFRDFARSVLGVTAPPLVVDATGDGLDDTFTMTEVPGGIQLTATFGGGGSVSVGPIPLPSLGLAGFFPGDFNGDSKADLIGHVAGVPYYFAGASQADFDFISNVVTSWNVLSSASNPLSYFEVGDFNRDGIDDAEVVRADGTRVTYLGAPQGAASPGLSQPAHLVPRGFHFYGPAEEQSLAMGAPGSAAAELVPGGNFDPVVGHAYLLTENLAQDGMDVQIADLSALKKLKSGPGSELGDEFGAALAWGNFDGNTDGYDTLVLGAPGTTRTDATPNGAVPRAHAGIVAQLRSDSTNPPSNAAIAYIDRFALEKTVAAEDRFGRSLAAGDFNGDGIDDLAIGQSGKVHVLAGVAGQLVTNLNPHVALTAQDFGFAGAFGFGSVLSTGDFNCDGYEDLAIGVPNAPADGFGSAGQVVVVYGGSAATGIVVPQASEVSRAQLIDESVAGGSPAVAHLLGDRLAAGNFNGDSSHGRPCIDLAMSASDGGGAVHVLFGGPGGLSGTGAQELRQGASILGGKIADQEEQYDDFGGSLAVTAADTDEFDDLVIGAWNEDVGKGVAHVLRGSALGVTATGQALWLQGQNGIPDIGETAGPPGPVPLGDHFGWTVGGTANGIVAIAAPWENDETKSVDRSGWATLIRVNDSATLQQPSSAVAVTEALLTVNGSVKVPLRKDAFFGSAITRARPAFVPVAQLPSRFDATMVFSGGGYVGNACATDNAPPVFVATTVSPGCLWPANKKLMPYRLGENISAFVLDDCDPQPDVRILSVQSNEATQGNKPQAQYILGESGACLRADRNGGGPGREYTVTLQARDDAGNAATTTIVVVVPHSQVGGSCPNSGNQFVKDGDPACDF